MVGLLSGVTVAQNLLMLNPTIQARLYLIQTALRRHLTSPCPLCGLSARGGDFCRDCSDEIQIGMRARARCRICADELAHEVDTALSDGAAGLLCDACKLKPPAFARAVVAMRYAFPTDGLMHDLKKRGHVHLAPMMARSVCQAAQASLPPDGLAKLSCIVPIPSSEQSIRRRGFNPPGEIARAVAQQWGLPCRLSWLRRTRAAGSQKYLDKHARQVAAAQVYESTSPLPPVWIGVVDDVMTTGSTMHHAALALRQGGAAGVIALCVMRTPRLVWHNTQHV